MFKNLKIGKKLGLGFGVVLLLLLIVSGYNYSSFTSIDEKTGHAQAASNNQAFAIAKEVDHLKWMAKLIGSFPQGRRDRGDCPDGRPQVRLGQVDVF